jgi:hypothetical protein
MVVTGIESNVFILRIWYEPREIAGATAIWRGRIEHIPSGNHRYLDDLDEIKRFIVPYLVPMGIDVEQLHTQAFKSQLSQRGVTAMTERLSYAVSVQVTTGPKMSASNQLEIQAYDKAQVILVDGDSDIQVNIQPDGVDLTHFLSITASVYSSSLTYKVNDAAATEIQLDGPHVFIGAGAVGLLDPAPTTLFFGNATGGDVRVTVLVGRDAIP